MADQDIFLLIDGHALIYRAFHAFPGLSTRSGVLVNAVYGFTRILLTAIQDFRPVYLGVAFDHPQPTFRHQAYAKYKATRAEMPDDLKPQIAMVKRVVETLNIPSYEVPGFEADDLIGTLTRQAEELVESKRQPRLLTIVVTGDRDALQLVSPHVRVWMPARGKNVGEVEYDRQTVKDKMGVFPEQIIDLKALMGDASDNIPGVKGVGEKTAVKLIQEFESVENVYQQLPTAESIPGSVKAKLEADKDSALLSKDLATINRQAPVSLELEACRVSSYDKQQVITLFEEFEFKSMIPLLPSDEFEKGVQDALF